VGTAKPRPADPRVPYHCLDLVEPGEPYSAALFQQDARAAIAGIAGRGAWPVLAGGTGLYVRAALDDMTFPPGELDSATRARYEALADGLGAQGLHDLLAQRDPASAELVHPNNVRRVVRALEMLDQGSSYAEQAAGFSVYSSVYDPCIVGLEVERGVLYERIDARVEAMLAEGLLDEVERLLAEGYRSALTATQAIGYKELVPVVEEGADLREAVSAIKQATRRYAKRQLTWFRADPRVQWIDVTRSSCREAATQARALVESFARASSEGAV
jgi:tRNA dimethylallyltransferase